MNSRDAQAVDRVGEVATRTPKLRAERSRTPRRRVDGSRTPKRRVEGSRTLAMWGLGGFILLGLPDGMWGTAWPGMRQHFHQPLGNLGLILIFATAGNLLTSLATGRLLRVFGAGRLLGSAALIAALGATTIATAPRWWLILAGASLIGLAAGLLDTGLNIVVALSGRMRLLNMLHGAYGIGSSLGPLVVTVSVLWTSWRPAYVLVIALELVLALGWWRTRAHWPVAATTAPSELDDDSDVHAEARADVAVDVAASARAEPRHIGVLIALGVTVFFFYTGFEVTAGQWAASYFRGALGLSAGTAGPAVFVYWSSLTAARFAVAIPRRTPNPALLIRIGCAGAVGTSLLIWWAPSVPLVIVAFAVMGICLAPVFPALVSLTPSRIGHARAHHVIGWQIAAANVGAAGVSALTGIILQHRGLTALGPCLLVVAAVMVACNATLDVLSRRWRLPAADGPLASR